MLESELDAVYPQAFDRLEELELLPESIGENVMRVLLTRVCQCQNVGNIETARRAIERIPSPYRRSLLPRLIDQSVALDDEWEYRRAVELLLRLEPSLVETYVSKGMTSPNEAVREAARDFQEAKGDITDF